MVNYNQIDQKVNIDYQSKVDKKLQILNHSQGLLEG